MNFAPCLSTAMCRKCGAECYPEQLHDNHYELCSVCGDDLQATIDADAAIELDSDDAIISELLKCAETDSAEMAS